MSIAPLNNLVTGKPIDTVQSEYNSLTPGEQNTLQTAGGGQVSATPAEKTAYPINSLLYQILIGAAGLGIIIIGLVMLMKTDLNVKTIAGAAEVLS